MKKLGTLLTAIAVMPLLVNAQERYGTRSGHIAFYSETPIENIEANNHKASSVFDASTGAMEFAVLIKAFEFEKALMQEHFNENYMESNTFPKATFKGTITGVGTDELKVPGTYVVQVSGDLTIHGVKRPLKTTGAITVTADGKVKASSEFIVKPEDHGIKIPGVVRKNIAETIAVKVLVAYDKL